MDKINDRVLQGLRNAHEVYLTAAWMDPNSPPLHPDWIVAYRAHAELGERGAWFVQSLFGLAHLEADLGPAIREVKVPWDVFIRPAEQIRECVASNMMPVGWPRLSRRVVTRLREGYWAQGQGDDSLNWAKVLVSLMRRLQWIGLRWYRRSSLE